MKILWHSVAPWVGTGYGTQTALFTRRLRDLGHDVAISAYYGLMGAEWRWQGMRCLPAYAQHYGTDVIIPHALHHFGASVGDKFSEASTRGTIITLGDVWTFQVPLLEHMSVAAWVPVDHETVPPIVSNWFGGTGAVPISMSRFGERALREAGLDPLYVPHGYDPKVFYPADQKAARERVGLPADAFIIAVVAANVGKDGSRKAFAEQITAFKQLHRKHPDAMLVLHTDVQTDLGVSILELLEGLPKTAYHYTDQYEYRKGIPASTVADIYRSADVLSNTSWGEGFGIPIMEAQAVGCPVIVTDTTAMPELVGGGWKVPGERFWHESQRAWARRPYIGGIVDAYEQAYEHARDEDLRARAWALAQDYDADTVTERYWVPVLDQISQALEHRRAERLTPIRNGKLTARIREADGLWWVDRGERTDDWVAYADHEPWVRPILEDLLPVGGVLLDVGAHVGRWSLRMASRASKVVAVEANPDTAATLRRHLAINDISNVTVVQLAAWDEHTTLQLEDPNDRQDGGGTRTLPHGGRGLDVDAAPLDDSAVAMLIEQAGRLDVVKMDVEGADLHALRGMAGLLEQYWPSLLIECHDIYGYYQRADLEATLIELGYEFEVAYSEPSTWMPDGPSEIVRMADYLVCRPVVSLDIHDGTIGQQAEVKEVTNAEAGA